MRHTYAKSLLSTVFVITALAANAQNSNKENAPYSRFGIGEQRNGVNTLLKGMGSISSAYTNPYAVNTDNPASYASLLLTTYEAGGEGSTRTVQGGTDKYRTGMATLSYMNVGIPIGKYAGMSFGLRPVSRVYYSLNDTTAVDTFGSAIKSYEGDGAWNNAFIGFAGKYKGFSLGFNFGYTFGKIDNISSLEPLTTSEKVVSSRFATYTRVGGISWKVGAMYEHALKKSLMIRGGGTVTLSQTLNASRDQYWLSYNNYSSQLDTAFQSRKVKGDITMPLSYSAGIQLAGSDRWVVGIDYSGANWSNYKSYGTTDSLASSTYKVSVGGEYTPNPASMRKYLQRVTYRLGAYYGTDPVELRNTQLDYYAVTAGLSLPFKRNTSRIHTSIEVGSRGTKTNGLIRETFVRFGLGISLNDKWFIKRKYD